MSHIFGKKSRLKHVFFHIDVRRTCVTDEDPVHVRGVPRGCEQHRSVRVHAPRARAQPDRPHQHPARRGAHLRQCGDAPLGQRCVTIILYIYMYRNLIYVLQMHVSVL